MLLCSCPNMYGEYGVRSRELFARVQLTFVCGRIYEVLRIVTETPPESLPPLVTNMDLTIIHYVLHIYRVYICVCLLLLLLPMIFDHNNMISHHVGEKNDKHTDIYGVYTTTSPQCCNDIMLYKTIKSTLMLFINYHT